MDDLILIKPTMELRDKIREYREEFFDHGENHINGSCGIAHYNNYNEWLDIVLSIEKEKLSRDHVHASTFFSVRTSDQKIVGSIQLRHFLTEDLEKYGGHIGYAIRPTERKKGYGRRQLQLVLDVAKEMKIPKVMISCDKDNVASSLTARSCGGILTSETTYKENELQIYWVSLE